MTQIIPTLDHVVINVLDQLDAAADLYRRLGFQLTERGHHTLGSSNHLAIFGENYVELLGYEPGRQTQRADLWKHPLGLTGLVFKTTESLALHTTLAEKGVPVENPAEFSRPVSLPEGTRDAAFRVVRLGSQLIPNGRVFFCHHFTPDLIWRDEWRQHPNGVVDIIEFTIVADSPSKTADLYRRIFGPEAVTDGSGGDGYLDRQSPEYRTIIRDNLHSLPRLMAQEPPPNITCEDLATLRMPVSIVHGSLTRPIFAIPSRAAARCIRHAGNAEVPGVGHLWPQESPRGFAAMVEELDRTT